MHIKQIAVCVLAAAVVYGASGCASRSVTQHDNVVDAKDRKQLKQRERLPVDKRIKAVVLDFEDRSQFGRGRLGTAASNILTTFLSRSGQFALYEREKLPDLFAEQKIKASGGAMNLDEAVRIGKVLGVDYIFTGVVSNFGFRSKTSSAFLANSSRQEAEATVDVRMIEVATGRIISSESGTGTSATQSARVLGVGGTMGYDETMSGDALRAAISQFVDVLIDDGLANR